MSLTNNPQISISRQSVFATWCLILCNALSLITSTYIVLSFQNLLVLSLTGYKCRLNQEPIDPYSPWVTSSPLKASLHTIERSSCAILILQLLVNGIVAYAFLAPLLRPNEKKRVVPSEDTVEDGKQLAEAADPDTNAPETHTEEGQRVHEGTQIMDTMPTNSDPQSDGPPVVGTDSPPAPVSDTGSKSPILADVPETHTEESQCVHEDTEITEIITTDSDTQSKEPSAVGTDSPSAPVSGTGSKSPMLANEPQLPDLYAEPKQVFSPGDIMRLGSLIFALGEDTIPKHILNASQATVESLFAAGTLNATHIKSAWDFLFRDRDLRRFTISRAAWDCHSDIVLSLDKISRFSTAEVDEALWAAVAKSDEELVRKWRSRLTNSWMGALTYTPLHLAAQKGNLNIMTMLLNQAIFTRDRLTLIMESLLQMAIEHWSLDIADVLIDRGADQFSVFLDSAVVAGHAGIVEEWLKEGATEEDTVCGPMLQTACVNGHTEVVRVLLDYGHDINEKSSGALGGNTPLMGAVSGNHPSLVEFLISRGASLDGTSQFGNALQTAAFWNYMDVARILVENGFDVDARAASLPTPQAMALRRGNWDMVTLLKQKGASREAWECYDRLQY
ncbi:ankyrin [Aspergillus sclerotiicarbonarius CBS 121057]|uniref:Ankyrin n=1 Tax=Aspergillus sclerotiicarbonarius (strain CBS 121057 / IBT 28362) TaxID=1448318 RepID=A0A319EIT4_ASPSB|nr:ankyrin [Aspergillus sclerotiicarbonarius CBS 121057]